MDSPSPYDVVAYPGEVFPQTHPDRLATMAALVRLRQGWPASVPFRQLPGLSPRGEPAPAESAAQGPRAEPAGAVAEFFLRAYALGFVELHVMPPPLVNEVSARPTASPLARLQLQSSHTVSTLRHADLQLQDSLGRHLVQLPDGTRDRAALLRDLTCLVRDGSGVVQREGKPVSDLDRAVEIVAAELEQNLAVLARLGLLAA
jgi:protein-lysine methyltransferase-like protein